MMSMHYNDQSIYVTAKIRGHQKVLAAVSTDFQLSTGKLYLQQCCKLLRIFGDDSNRLALLQELRQTPDASNICRSVPYPFVMTCLKSGCSFDALAGRHFNSQILPQDPVPQFPASCWLSENSLPRCGNIVIDITDLRDLRYCFVVGASFFLSAAYPPSYSWTRNNECRLACIPAKDYILFQDGRLVLAALSEYLTELETFSLIDESCLCRIFPVHPYQRQTRYEALTGNSYAGMSIVLQFLAFIPC